MPKGSYIKTEAHRKNLSKSLTGKIQSPEHVLKNRKGHLGQKAWNKGKKGVYSDIVIQGMKERARSRVGVSAANWRGGVSKKSGYHKIYSSRHRARKKEALGTHNFGEWELLKKQYGFTCPCCQKAEPEIQLTEDHIIPLSKGGSDSIENIQPLCQSCNSKKHTRIIKYKVKI